MKVGIVGSGFVGATAAYAMVMRGVGREIVLVDRNQARAQAEANDLWHAVPFAKPLTVRAGEYADLADAAVVVLTAGVNQQPGETRLQLLSRNAAVFAEVVPQVLQHAPTAVLVIATNPVDVMTHYTAHLAARLGVPATRIIGSGTTLDTARLRVLIGQHCGVDAQHVHGYVLGEHGDSEVIPWSTINIAGMDLLDFCRERDVALNPETMAEIDTNVRRAAYQIISGKGATYYGIGSALARIVDVILHNQRAVLSVCTRIDDVCGVRDVTLALPHLVGGTGILDCFPPRLAAEEEVALRRSAEVIRAALAGLNL